MSTKPNPKSQKVIDYIIKVISKDGYESDRWGNYRKGDYRYKFNATSYRKEALISTEPASWMKVSGTYYKNVPIKPETGAV